MEAKALTTQDLTTDLTPNPTTAALDAVALTVVTDPAAPQPGQQAGQPADLADDMADDVPGELVTTEAARAVGPAFGQFGVAEPICAALAAAGIMNAFPIQALTLPIALDDHDVIGQARTGTGKTLAFAIPILQLLLSTSRGK